MVQWGDYDAGDCVHGEPGVTCRVCHPQREDYDSPWALVVLALIALGFVLCGPSAIRRELANDDAQARRHRAHVERHVPSLAPEGR